MHTITLFFIFIISINHIWNLKVIFERANVVYANEKYVTGVKINVRRYTRRGDYYLNLSGTLQQTWANNISLNYVFYEFLHNEYKRSFVEFQVRLCDLVNKEKFIGGSLLAAGLQCPVPAREWSLSNLSVSAHDFPNVWPFEKCRLDVKVETYPEKDYIGDLQIYLLLKQTLGK